MKNPLGVSTPFSTEFDPAVLYPIPRAQARAEIGIREPLPFEGRDRWVCYEASWLQTGSDVPQVGIATIEYPASSPFLIESKSLKLFLGSMNFTQYVSPNAVAQVIQQELSRVLHSESLTVSISSPHEWSEQRLIEPPGECVDNETLDPSTSPRLRAESDEEVEEVLHSHLLRSLCPVTSQPDWGTLVISYRGKKLHRPSLLTYLIAHRSYQAFHEQCCERIFADVVTALSPSKLWVGCFYTRRGGIEINPERWLPGSERLPIKGRLARQ